MLLFVVVLAIYGSSPVVQNGDPFLISATAQSLLHQQDLTIDEHLGPGTAGGAAVVVVEDEVRGPIQGVDLPRALAPGEHAYDYYPWLTAVLVVPVVAGFEGAAALGFGRLDVDRMLATGDVGLIALVSASLLTALSVVVLSTLAWHALSDLPATRRRRLAWVVGLVVALGTPAWSTLSRAPWSQTASLLFSSVAVLMAFRLATRPEDDPGGHAPRLALVLGASAAGAYMARPTGALLVIGLGVWLLVVDRPLVPWLVLGASLVAVPWVVVNLTTWGHPQAPYYDTDRAGLGSDTLEGVAANLVSPNRGLFVFSSLALLSVVGFVVALRRRGPVPRSLALAAGSVVVAHLIVVAGSGEAWWAGASYGPRFMADVVPELVLLAMPVVAAAGARTLGRAWQAAIVGLAALSVAMHAPGAWSKPAQCWNVEPVSIDLDPGRVWDWGDMQALRPARVVSDGGSLRDAVLQRCDDAGAGES
jgi:hypothetical protein